MRRFITDQLCDETGECANLNYWAFWVGDFAEQQTGDAFMGTTPLSAWHGNRLLRHLLDRLYGNIGFLELNNPHIVVTDPDPARDDHGPAGGSGDGGQGGTVAG